jgi:hypothetical protein
MRHDDRWLVADSAVATGQARATEAHAPDVTDADRILVWLYGATLLLSVAALVLVVLIDARIDRISGDIKRIATPGRSTLRAPAHQTRVR